jgi:hypothetical protein
MVVSNHKAQLFHKNLQKMSTRIVAPGLSGLGDKCAK